MNQSVFDRRNAESTSAIARLLALSLTLVASVASASPQIFTVTNTADYGSRESEAGDSRRERQFRARHDPVQHPQRRQRMQRSDPCVHDQARAACLTTSRVR